MKLYYSDSYSDEDGLVNETKTAMIYGTKEELIKICSFFEVVKKHLENNNVCHMQLCDNFEGWEKNTNFDLEVNLKED